MIGLLPNRLADARAADRRHPRAAGDGLTATSLAQPGNFAASGALSREPTGEF
ncbi:MAG TPA: hypothetical protein VJQ77_01955 [Novosphingobium sp.]|nr:hypothetical protein [Novosphingobium sp.]